MRDESGIASADAPFGNPLPLQHSPQYPRALTHDAPSHGRVAVRGWPIPMSAANDSEATTSHRLTVRLGGLMALCYLLARKHVLHFTACQRAVSCRKRRGHGGRIKEEIPMAINPDDFPAPKDGFILTHFLVVSDQDRSRELYKKLFNAKVLIERDPV